MSYIFSLTERIKYTKLYSHICTFSTYVSKRSYWLSAWCEISIKLS